MTDIIFQVLAHIRGMWRFRWQALLLTWLMCLVGWAWVYTLPNQYQSTTRVYVDTESALRKILKGIATETNTMSKVSIMTRMLLTKPNLEKVARETDLDLRAGTPEQMEQLIQRLQRTIQIQGTRNNVFLIGYRDTDPRVAQTVVQTLLSDFVSNTLAGNARELDQTLRFLEVQIAEYEQRLRDSEERLAQFKKDNVGRMPGSEGGYYERLQSGMAKLKQTEDNYQLALSRRDELNKQLEGEEPVFDIMGSTSAQQPAMGSTYDAQLGTMKSRLDSLRLNFTDKHPDIVALQGTIERLEAQREEELASVRATRSQSQVNRNFNPLDANPVFQTLRVELSRAEVELSQLRTQLTQDRRQVAELQASINTVPEVEAQLARLNRDYQVTKARYETLLNRLETARMGDQANTQSDDVRFQIMDPPSLPLEPAGPDRLLFLSVILFAALGAGVAFAFLLNQIRPVFNSRHDLRKVTGLPVLGTLTAILLPGERRAKRLSAAAFAFGLALLAFCFAGAVMFEEPATELIQRIQHQVL